jgi:hypothetical protein
MFGNRKANHIVNVTGYDLLKRRDQKRMEVHFFVVFPKILIYSYYSGYSNFIAINFYL